MIIDNPELPTQTNELMRVIKWSTESVRSNMVQPPPILQVIIIFP
jgi:hypothetical protein